MLIHTSISYIIRYLFIYLLTAIMNDLIKMKISEFNFNQFNVF